MTPSQIVPFLKGHPLPFKSNMHEKNKPQGRDLIEVLWYYCKV
jgi:hypothetical protein